MTENFSSDGDPHIQILVVDDDITVRYLMNEFMELLGYSSHMAENGEDAVAYLGAHSVDIVITDIIMPGMDGLELTRHIKQTHPQIEVIVMTGFAGDYSYEEVIRLGAADFVFKPVRFEELKLRLERVLRERRLKEKLKKISITDDRTQLFNDRYFDEQIHLEVERANRYRRLLSLLLLDIDNFKRYNDTFGHMEGNVVLARMGQIIKKCLRENDSAYRFGGEEFTVILPETDGKKAHFVAQRISVAIASQKFYPEAAKAVRVTVSVGITEYCQGESVADFIKRTDMAMYRAKQEGRNRIIYLDACDIPAKPDSEKDGN